MKNDDYSQYYAFYNNHADRNEQGSSLKFLPCSVKNEDTNDSTILDPALCWNHLKSKITDDPEMFEAAREMQSKIWDIDGLHDTIAVKDKVLCPLLPR